MELFSHIEVQPVNVVVFRESALNRLIRVLTSERIVRWNYGSLPESSTLGEVGFAYINCRSHWNINPDIFEPDPLSCDRVRIDYAEEGVDGQITAKIITPLWTEAVAAALVELIKLYQKEPELHEKIFAVCTEKLELVYRCIEEEAAKAKFQEIMHISERFRNMAIHYKSGMPDALARRITREGALAHSPFYRDLTYQGLMGDFVEFEFQQK
jgi:hypothetical protein